MCCMAPGSTQHDGIARSYRAVTILDGTTRHPLVQAYIEYEPAHWTKIDQATSTAIHTYARLAQLDLTIVSAKPTSEGHAFISLCQGYTKYYYARVPYKPAGTHRNSSKIRPPVAAAIVRPRASRPANQSDPENRFQTNLFSQEPVVIGLALKVCYGDVHQHRILSSVP